MMSDFLLYAETGLNHGLSIQGLPLILFLLALAIPYSFKDRKRLFLLCTLFSIGYVLALLFSAFGIVIIKASVVGILVPITTIIAAFYNLCTAGRLPKKEAVNLIGFVLFFFGIIHGLGFSGYFKSLFSGNPAAQIVLLLEFVVGILGAEAVVLLTVLILSYIIHTFFRFSKRDFVLVLSALVVGIMVPLIFGNEIWN